MKRLNEAGLQAAAEAMGNDDGEGYHNNAAAVIEAYFEHAEIDTRRRLHPADRSEHLEGHTKKFEIGGIEGYITVNCFPNGQPGEIFFHGVGKEGSTVRGFMELAAIFMSVGLQYGVPLEQFTKFMVGMDFEPKDSEYSSIPDHIGRYLRKRYGSQDEG